MNQGKRYIRNTVIAMCGVTVLVAGATRLYAAVVDGNTPRWLRSVVSLGLVVAKVEPESTAPQPVDLPNVPEFTQVEVEGPFAVEIIGAQRHKVSMTPASGKTRNTGSDWNPGSLLPIKGGPIRIKGGPEAVGAVLRIEVPTLTSIDVKGVESLTVRGLQAPEVSLRMQGVKAVQLLDCKVGAWKMNAVTPVEVRMGNGTSSDVNMKVTGKSTVMYAPREREKPRP